MKDISEVWERLGGEAGGASEAILALVDAFYEGVPSDPHLGPMYPKDDLVGAKERLALFLLQRFGGPALYAEKRGHPRLGMRHSPFSIGPAARDAWLARMRHALDATPALAPVRAELDAFFEGVAVFLQNQPTDA